MLAPVKIAYSLSCKILGMPRDSLFICSKIKCGSDNSSQVFISYGTLDTY